MDKVSQFSPPFMNSAVPAEVSKIAEEFKFKWTGPSFQHDISALMRLIREKISREMRYKQGYVLMQVGLKTS
jgi:hypothetical protein